MRIVCIAPGHDQVRVAGRVEPERGAQPDVQRLGVAAPGVHDERVRRHEDRLPPPEAADPHVHGRRCRRRRGAAAATAAAAAAGAAGRAGAAVGAAGAGALRLQRRSCSSRSCWATTWSRYTLRFSLTMSCALLILDAYQSADGVQ